jgi:hypothetical protein
LISIRYNNLRWNCKSPVPADAVCRAKTVENTVWRDV